MNPLPLVLGSYRAEWLKLSRRPAIWILVVIFWLGVLIAGYFFWFLYIQLIQRSNPGTPPPDLGNSFLVPSALLSNVIPNIRTFGAPIGIILGTLLVGGEYSWGTLKTILTQRPGRLALLGGKFLGLAVFVLILSVGALLLSYIVSLITALIIGASGAPPSALELLKGLGAAWLIIAVWATFGAVLATLFRSSALAIGIGLVYTLVIETAVSGVAAFLTQFSALERALPGANAGFITDALSGNAAATGDTGSAGRAVAILVAYVVAFVAISALVTRQRDVI
jgi:ABC-2 type transport system permease protein